MATASESLTTTTGLTVHAELDKNTYERGIRIPDNDMKTLEETGILTRHDFHGDWNYSINPRDTPKQPT
jgi:hypothetical protein